MDIMNVDEVIDNLVLLCNYKQLILLSRLNKKYNGLCNNINYDIYQILAELNIKIVNTILIKKHMFKFKINITREKYDQLEEFCISSFKNAKTGRILNIKLRIFVTGDCCSYYCNVEDFFKAYKLLVMM